MPTADREALPAQLVRWSWVTASALGTVALAVLFYVAQQGSVYIFQALLVAVSYPTVMLPMFLLKSVVAGRPGRALAATALAAIALLVCRELLELYQAVTLDPIEYAIAYPATLAWAVALAIAITAMGVNMVHRRLAFP